MAEGIKISDMEQVTTLQDDCCFPIVSNGENKKITKKDLYLLMTTDLQSQITNILVKKTLNNKDLNDVRANGVYTIGDTSLVTNLPSDATWGLLEVFNSGNYQIQKYINGANQKSYIRFSVGSTWANWKSYDNDIASLQNQLTNYKDSLQSQINSIKKPDGIEIFRMGVNIPESSFTEQSAGAGSPQKEYKYTLPKTNARIVDYKLTIECGCNDNENGTVTIYMPTSMNGATNRICKGYIEYVEI